MARRMLCGGRHWICGLAGRVSGIRRQKGHNMRTALYTFALATTAALVVAGCGGSETPPAEAPTEAAAPEKAAEAKEAAPKAEEENKAEEETESAKPEGEEKSEEAE